MSTATINGHTYTDDSNAITGMGSGGHKKRFIASLSDAIAVASEAQDTYNLANRLYGESNTLLGGAQDNEGDIAQPNKTAVHDILTSMSILAPEPALGNPATTGLFLKSTDAGVRSWGSAGVVGTSLGSLTLGSIASSMILSGLNLALDPTKRYLFRMKIIVETGQTIGFLGVYVNTLGTGKTFGLSGNTSTYGQYSGTTAYFAIHQIAAGQTNYVDSLLFYNGKYWVFKTLATGDPTTSPIFSQQITIPTSLAAITTLGVTHGANSMAIGSKIELFEYKGVIH